MCFVMGSYLVAEGDIADRVSAVPVAVARGGDAA